MRLILAIVFLIVLANAAFAADSRVAKAPACDAQVAAIFANLISVQNGVEVKPENVTTGHLTKYQWTVYTTLPNGKFVEYMAEVDMEENCNIKTMIEGDDEQPAFNHNWERQE